MPLKKSLIATVAVCALALPATTATVLTLTATPAFAKAGGNGNGKGGGGDHGNSSKDNSRSNKPARASSNGNGPANANRANTPAVVPAAATGATETAGMSPSELGSMNGALHANINAVLAHIRNGNTSGPVGALAGLAMADYNAAGAQDLLDLAAQYDALASALEEAGFASMEEYEAALEAGETEAIAAIDDAKAALGDAADGEAPSEDDIAAAEAALADQQAAEDGILDAWNKSGEASDEEKAELLQALRDRLDAENEAIATTMEEVDLASATEEVAEEEPAAE